VIDDELILNAPHVIYTTSNPKKQLPQPKLQSYDLVINIRDENKFTVSIVSIISKVARLLCMILWIDLI